MTDDVRQRLADHVRLNPDDSAARVIGSVGANPEKWKDVVADALDASDPEAALRNGDTDRREGDPSVCEQETPTPQAGKTPIHDDDTEADSTDGDADDEVEREAAVDALADVLRFYNARLDDEIADHTDAGDHPERPTTAREYFTEVRGWNDDTVDELMLGWAPPNHVDQLVAYLHDRGHSRAAMLATGVIGESDSGGLYATFSARYVLPYYDASGRPAYAIARCTGGDGGGARGYGGHPADYQAGKYAKLRHTDDRVPFSEPIYGLDTLDAGDHVVVAEGIADAITARENGYAVLSPVAKEFKNDHLDPLADALDSHEVGRVSIVADADSIRNDTTGDADVDTIGDAVGTALSPTGAGLAGALRTAAKLGDRSEADLRVVVPPAPGDTENDLDEFVSGAWGGDLDALLRSAKPPESFDEWESVSSSPDASAEESADFDAEDYEPSATDSEETTGEIRDIYVALDRLDAQNVAEKTIVAEWLEGADEDDEVDHRTFRPTWAADNYSGTAVYCDHDKFVDTGSRGGFGGPAVMAAIDAGLVSDTQCPDAVSGETWVKAVDHLRGLGFSVPKFGDSDDADSRSDPRERVATVDMRRAWEAAGRVTPEQLDDDLGLTTTDDGTGWLAGDDRITDVVRAVAVADGRIDTPDDEIDDYPAVYTTAREQYGAPLPRYYTTADAIAEFDAVLDVIGEATFFDLNTDALNSEITAVDDEVGGDAVRALNPAWRDSESGESVLVFDSGAIWDADTERVIDVLRFVALDTGRIDSPGESIEGEAFTDAYQLARTEYGAPLPRWEPATDGSRQLTPQLPAAEELVDGGDFDGIDDDALGDAREAVEELLADRLADSDEPTVITSLPATGKTTGTIKNAADRPLSYLAPRKELQKQALSKAADWNVDAEVLPVFCDEQVREDILDAAVSHVRNAGKDRLRDRWAVLMNALAAVGDDGAAAPDADDLFSEPDDDEVDLDRPTCETARGDHGPAWALAVHIARRLGYTPREIHQQASGLFGAPLPCEAGDNNQCEYSDGWKRVTDADAPADLLVGSYVHAHVESVRTHYDHDTDENIERTPRAVVLDEFPGDAFVREFDESAVDHATWLARSLVDEVEDRRDMRAADLHTDKWVRAWLDGRGDEAIPTTIRTLERFGALFDAREAAGEIRAEVDSRTLETLGLADPLAAVEYDDAADAFDDLAAAVDSVTPEQRAAGVARWADEAVREPLAVATIEGDSEPTIDAVGSDDALPESGDLRALVDQAAAAVDDASDEAAAAVDAAITALRGGRDGCRRLAAWADDGYAHPDAHHLLTADMTPTGEAETTTDDAVAVGRRLQTDSWAFDDAATDGTVLDHVETGPRSTVVADRNDHGALLHTPPSRQSGGGGEVPLVGLDATGRAELWSTALGESVRTADIHTTDSQRAEFLETALSLRVIQAADRPRPYEGDPSTKDTDGDVALLEAIADEYAGIEAPRSREEAAATIGSPAVITTKGVRDLLETDSRLDDTVAEFENYGNITGANDLGDHQLAAILGSQHYGDDAVERFCALAGEQVNTDRAGGRGAALDYENALANTYLKHMRDDQTMQAILRFARGDSGATVVARTSALRDDLPVVGRGQVVETWSDTATKIARRYRRLGGEFTIGDVADAVDVTRRQVRRVLAELVEAGYLRRLSKTDGKASVFQPAAAADPGAGEVALPSRNGAVDAEAGHDAHNQYYTWNVRVPGRADGDPPVAPPADARTVGAPPSPAAVGGDPPPE